MGVPQTRPNWNVSASIPGTMASKDNAALDVTEKVLGAGGLVYGSFCNKVAAGGVKEVETGDVNVYGIALVDNQASSDTANPKAKYLTDDAAAIGRRGFFWMNNDPDNLVALDSALRVGFAAGKEGFMTTDVANSILIAGGIRIEQVIGNVVEIYLDGSALYLV